MVKISKEGVEESPPRSPDAQEEENEFDEEEEEMPEPQPPVSVASCGVQVALSSPAYACLEKARVDNASQTFFFADQVLELEDALHAEAAEFLESSDDDPRKKIGNEERRKKSSFSSRGPKRLAS